MNEKILIVDDDENICELLRLYLSKEGYAPLIVNDGLAAVEQAPGSEIAKEYVAIADMIMAGKTEREELRHE